jgi:2'-5' RNA ligase
MRLFVAIKISEELQEEILEWEKSWLSRFPEGNRGSSMTKSSGPVRWVAGKNLHITLIPPWEEENIAGVGAILKTLEEKIGPFEMVLEKVEFGPHFDNPRLIWAEGKAPKEIQDLKIKVENVLGRKPDSRPFKLHLTLARFNSRDFVRFPIKNLDEEVFWKQEVKSIVLMESQLLPEGAEYEVLEEIRL